MNHDHRTATEALDPVCGMSIAPEDATGTVEYKGTNALLLQSVRRGEVPRASGELPGSGPAGRIRSSGGGGIHLSHGRPVAVAQWVAQIPANAQNDDRVLEVPPPGTALAAFGSRNHAAKTGQSPLQQIPPRKA